MNDDDDGIDIVDMFKKASDFVDDNEDLVRSFIPEENQVDIGEQSPLKSAIVNDDEVIVTVEVKNGKFEDITVKRAEEGVIIGMNGDKVKANIPNDVDIDGADAMLNNGVLEVTLPRQGGDE